MINLGVRRDTVLNKLGFRVGMYLYNTTSSSYVRIERIIATNSELKDGWALLSLAIDNLSVGTITKMYYRVRTFANGKDGVTEDLQLTYRPTSLDKQDYYIGG